MNCGSTPIGDLRFVSCPEQLDLFC